MDSKGLISWGISLYVLAAILPGAITSLMTANTSGWTATVSTIWELIPIIAIAYVITRE